MGLTLTLTDEELPASPAFVDFLHAWLSGGEQRVGTWYLQEEELLDRSTEDHQDLAARASAIMRDPQGRDAIVRAYRYFKEMLTGRPDTVRELNRFHFIFIVGIPRSGGTYMTKQLLRAAGIDYRQVPHALAHDGFPHLTELSFPDRRHNAHTTSLLQLAEYFVMVELYFQRYGRLAFRGGVVVPKKFTKLIYNFPLIRELVGTRAEYLITLRHPLGVMQSVLDKSGGMPSNGLFAVRSAIERWALDEAMRWGANEAQVMQLPYAQVMLDYWKRFHMQLAISGIPSMPTAKLVTFGAASMTGVMKEYYRAFGITLEPEAFKEAAFPEFAPELTVAALAAINDVAQLWRSVGMRFPGKL